MLSATSRSGGIGYRGLTSGRRTGGDFDIVLTAGFETGRGLATVAHEVQPIEEIPADQGDEAQMVEFETQSLLNSKALQARHDDVAVEQRHAG